LLLLLTVLAVLATLLLLLLLLLLLHSMDARGRLACSCSSSCHTSVS
jgi:hypothetical protein